MIWARLLTVSLLLTASGWPVFGQETTEPVALAVRIAGGETRSLLARVTPPTGRVVDELRIELPRGTSERAVLMNGPAGWTMERDGRWVHLTGDAVSEAFRVRVTLFHDRELERLKVELRAEGRRFWDERVDVRQLAPLRTSARTSGFLSVPAGVNGGETVELEVLDPSATQPSGQWLIAGVEAVAAPNNRIRVALPSDLPVGAPVRVTFFDEWGERVVDALSAEDVTVTEPPAPPLDAPRLTGCAEYGFIGRSICVCGNFPETSWTGLRIDGQPAEMVSASRQVVQIRLPDTLTPGVHTITGDPEQGFAPGEAVSVQAVRMRASIDAQALQRGTSTDMHVTIEGTNEPMTIVVMNRTPGIIAIPGGNYQELTTSGGTENSFDRRVDARNVGGFYIDTYVPGPACPCLAEPQEVTSTASREQPLFVPRRVLATIVAAAPQAALVTAQAVALANGLGVVEVNPIVLTNEALVVFEILDGIGAVAKAAALAADPNVTLAQPDFVYDVTQDASGASRLVYGTRLIGADVAHDVSNGSGVRVAVIDSGVDIAHPALENRVAGYEDVTGSGWTPDAHGTLVAGVIAAEAVEDAEIVGIAPEAEIFAVKSCVSHRPSSAAARCWSSTLTRGIDSASQQDVQVMNLSVGGPEDRLLARAVDAARDAGIAVVSAVGNDGPSGKPSYPAAFDDVIAVTAVDAASRIYPRATRGGFVDLAAPGVDILSTGPGGRTQLFSGTSAATAFTTGAVALLLQHGDLSPAEIRTLLRETARDLGESGPDTEFGQGLLDVCRAIALSSGDDIACR